MRGLFSVGVMDVMMEHNLAFDGIIGVSAGAAYGCNMKSRQPGRAIRYNKRFARDWRFCSVRSLLLTGDMFGGEFDYHTLPTTLDIFDAETFDRNPQEFYAVCTDVLTGEPVYKLLMKSGYDCYEWIRASASMPLAARVVSVEGRKMLDGGISDSIPLRRFQEMGYSRNVVILTQPEGYVKKPNKFLPLMRLALRKYPRFVEAAARRHEMYNEELAYVKQQEKLGCALVIRPAATLTIGHISSDPAQMQATYDLGRAEGLRRLDEMRRFLHEENT